MTTSRTRIMKTFSSQILVFSALAGLLAVPSSVGASTPRGCPFPPLIQSCDRQLAEAQQAADDATSTSSASHTVSGSCAGKASISQGDFQAPTTWAVIAEAHAASTSAIVYPLATGVVCYVRDADSGAQYGAVHGGLPGGQALAFGTVQTPAAQLVAVCVIATATFSDGVTVTSSNSC
jgi:hypothetical protein